MKQSSTLDPPHGLPELRQCEGTLADGKRCPNRSSHPLCLNHLLEQEAQRYQQWRERR